MGVQTTEDRESELELSNSPLRRYRTPKPEAHSLPLCDEHTDEENRRNEADHEFRLRTMPRNESGQFKSSSAEKRSLRSSMGEKVNTDEASLSKMVRTAHQTEQSTTRRKQLPIGKNIATRKPTISHPPRRIMIIESSYGAWLRKRSAVARKGA
jgi:hypothetical protein